MKIIYKHVKSDTEISLDLLHDDIEQKVSKHNLESLEWDIQNNFLNLSFQYKKQKIRFALEVLKALSEASKKGIPPKVIGKVYEYPYIKIQEIDKVYLGCYNSKSIKSLEILYPGQVLKFFDEDNIYAFELKAPYKC